MTPSLPASPAALHFPTVDGTGIELVNPFRGTLIVGAPGSGKTSSLAAPMADQFARKHFAGLTYSATYPLSTNGSIADKALQQHHLDFYDFGRSEKVNPLHPALLDSVKDAYEVANNLLASLFGPHSNPESEWTNYFTTSCASYLGGIIWYYRQHHPALCTLPHVLATVAYDDFPHVLQMLSLDKACLALVRSMVTALKQNADKQIAGIVASLQVDTSSLLIPEVVWLLCPDEAMGEGFSLNLNDPAHPTQLTIATHPELARAFSPVISCVIAAALKQMNRPHQHPSYAVLDDAETLYLPGLEALSATASSHQLALVCIAPDLPALIAPYGKEKVLSLVKNLNNQLFGKITAGETALLLARLVGTDDLDAGSQEVVALGNAASASRPGEFIGQFGGPAAPIFRCALRPPAPGPDRTESAIKVPEALTLGMAAKLLLVRRQVAETVNSYPNLLSIENRNRPKP